tara:strand:- start:2414 stop:3274 length:861 start_codon:yes stop_codon:yes gene_type:complete
MKEILEILKKSIVKIAFMLKNNNSLDLGKITMDTNNTGDMVKKFDIMSNEILIRNLKNCSSIRRIFSEEIEEPIIVNPKGKYMVTFDPLDGSGNLDVNISSGTIFGIFIDDDNDIIRASNIVAAGYGLYSAATQYVEVVDSINIYQIINGKMELIKANHIIPPKGKLYSFNHTNYDFRHPILDRLISECHHTKHTCRWAGCMVADAHRIMLKGGWWCYPGTETNYHGKIRLLYEAIPFSYIFKIGKGQNSSFSGDIMDIVIDLSKESGHKRTPIILASSEYELQSL